MGRDSSVCERGATMHNKYLKWEFVPKVTGLARIAAAQSGLRNSTAEIQPSIIAMATQARP